jgi:hypothetical protein
MENWLLIQTFYHGMLPLEEHSYHL